MASFAIRVILTRRAAHGSLRHAYLAVEVLGVVSPIDDPKRRAYPKKCEGARAPWMAPARREHAKAGRLQPDITFLDRLLRFLLPLALWALDPGP